MNEFYSLSDFLLHAEKDLEENEELYNNLKVANEVNPPEWIMQNIRSYLRSLNYFKSKGILFDLTLN